MDRHENEIPSFCAVERQLQLHAAVLHVVEELFDCVQLQGRAGEQQQQQQ